MLVYGPERMSFHFDDASLAHLQAIATAKLRRNECFFVSWRDPQGVGGGRSAIWLHHAIPLAFHFDACERPPLDRQLLEEMAIAANGAGGLDLSDAVHLSRTAMPAHNSVKRHDNPLTV